MNFFQEFRTETKLLLVVALVAIVLAVGGIWLLRAGVSNQATHTPSPTPQAQNEVLDTEDFTLSEVEGWQTYRSSSFEFDYPAKWNTIDFEDLTIVNDEMGKPFMTLTFANRTLIGISFCGAYPQNERCEIVKGNDIDFVIDWQPNEEAVAETTLNDNMALFLTLHRVEANDLFKQILSTFRFVEGENSGKNQGGASSEIFEGRADISTSVGDILISATVSTGHLLGYRNVDGNELILLIDTGGSGEDIPLLLTYASEGIVVNTMVSPGEDFIVNGENHTLQSIPSNQKTIELLFGNSNRIILTPGEEVKIVE